MALKRAVLLFGFILTSLLSYGQPVASYLVKGDTNLSPVRICRQYATQFQSISTGGIASVSWSFPTGNPSTSTANNVTVLWNTNGTKNCSLTVTDTSGTTNTLNFNVIIASNQPSASVGLLPDVCASDPAFPLTQGSPSGGVYFGLGVSNNRFAPGVADTGFHTIGYVYAAPNGCSDTAYGTIYVKPGPNASLLELNSFSNCNGFSFTDPDFDIELYDQSTSADSIISYEIIWGDGTLGWDSVAFRPGLQHTYFGQGIYQLKYILTSLNGCTDTAKYLVINTTNPASLNMVNPGGTNGCAPVTVKFPLSTTNTDTTITYNINWGDGTDTTFGHPPPPFITHTYDTTSCIEPSGFFNIQTSAQNACISTQSTLQGPFVTQPALTNFTPTNGCVNVPNSLPNLSIPGFTNACSRLTTFVWDFGDGSPPLTQIVNQPIPPAGVHTWTSPGIYNVTLISIAPAGNCPGDTLTLPVCIENPVSANVVISDTVGCQSLIPTIVNTTDTTSFCTNPQFGWFVDTTFGWSLAPGSTMNDLEPDIRFTEPGIYTLSFYNVNNCGGDTISQKIHVWDRPDISLPQNIQPYCDTVIINTATNNRHIPNIDANGTPITSYLWNISPSVNYLQGTDSTSQFPVFRLPPNTYTISLIVTNQCGSDTATQNVIVNTLTNGGYIINTQQGCSPLNITVQSTSSLGVQHTWYLDSTLYSTARDTSMTFINMGTQDSVIRVTLVVYSGIGCSDTINRDVTVYPGPLANFSAADVCIGDNTSFFDSSLAAVAPLNSWNWDFDNGDFSTSQNPVYAYPNPGRYYVGLTVTDTNGCSSLYQDSIWVRSAPYADFNFNYSSIPDSACIGDTVFMLDASFIDSNGTAIVDWSWDVFNDGVIDDTLQNSAFVFSNPGSFPVSLTVTSLSGCSSVYFDTIHVSNPSVPFFTLSSYGGCTPVTVVASNQSSGYITGYDWVFYTLDSNLNRVIEYTSSQTDPNPVPPFQANILSNKTVFVELTAFNGCYSATYTDTINIKPIPIPFFAFSSDTGCSPLTVTIQVDGLATGNPDSILFDFGDGTPNLTLMPNINILPNGDTLFTWNQQTHTFIYNGLGLDTTYFVTLYASNECGDSSYTVPINVRNRSVQSFFNASTNVGCAPLNVTFNDFSFAATSISYCFDFDTITKTCNGSTLINRNPTHVFLQPGVYVVAQFGLNSCGADTSYQVIDVRPKPNIQFTFPNNICANDSITFTNNTTLSAGNILGYTWYFGDGDSSFYTNPTHAYDTSGTYNVCLFVFTDQGCDSSYCQQITVNPTPVADFSFQNNICQNLQPIQFINSSSNGSGNIISYEWDFGDGNIATQINPLHTYLLAGTYDVKLVVTNDNFCKDSLIQQITILPVPEADFTFAYTSNDSCGAPQTIQFTNNSNGAGGYYWDFDYLNNPGQDTSILMHPNHTYNQPGYYEVMLISKNGLGCEDTVFKTINVHPLPNPDFVPNVTAGCAPLNVFFTNSTKLPTGFNDSIYYTWYFGDGTSTTQSNPEHRFVNPGTYSVKLVAQTENSCEDSVRYVGLITVFPVPEPQFVYTIQSFGVYNYTNQTTGGTPPYTYNWDFGDGSTSTQINPTHEFDIDKVGFENGFNVCLTVIDDNGCDSTWCDTVKVGAFTLYVPNAMAPDSDGEESMFMPKGQGLESYTCKIFDRWGNLLWMSDKLDPDTARPIEGWDGTYKGEPVPPGVYVWRIDATFANGVVWRGEGLDREEVSNSGTVTILR